MSPCVSKAHTSTKFKTKYLKQLFNTRRGASLSGAHRGRSLGPEGRRMGQVATKLGAHRFRRDASVSSYSKASRDTAPADEAEASGRVLVTSKSSAYEYDGGAIVPPEVGKESRESWGDEATGERDSQAKKASFFSRRSTGSIRHPEQPVSSSHRSESSPDKAAGTCGAAGIDTEGSWVSNPSTQPSQQGSPVRESVLRRAQSRPIPSSSGLDNSKGNPNSSGTFLSFGFRGGRKLRATSDSADNAIVLLTDYVEHRPKVL